MPVGTAVCIHAHVLKNLTHTLRDTAGLKPENFPMSSTSTAIHASKSMVPNEQPRPHIRDNNIRYSSTLPTSCGEALGFRKYSAQLFLRVNSIRRTLLAQLWYKTPPTIQAGYTRIVYIGFSFKKSSRLHVIGPSCICTIRLLLVDSKGCMGTVSARRRSLYIEGYLNLVPLHACIWPLGNF